MSIEAKVIAHSINTEIVDKTKRFGHPEIGTMVATFPRIILAEFNTHRMFSRNSASSRAIPFKKVLKSVQENPFIPLAWQEDHSGMQGTKYLSKTDKFELVEFTKVMTSTLNNMLDKESKDYLKLKEKLDEKIEIIKELLQDYIGLTKTLDEWWLFARDKAVETAAIMYVFNVTKQLCNRLLEPFMWHTVIVTATEWENFFALRCPKYHYEPENLYFRSRKEWIGKWDSCFEDSIHYTWTDLDWLKINKGQAEIHMMALAEAMWDAYNESTPKELKAGEWHIPFGDNINELKIADSLFEEFSADVEHNTKLLQETKIKIATARCARVSYTVVGEEGKPDNYEADIKLHDRLAASGHWSPFEHCAKAMDINEYNLNIRGKLSTIDHSKSPMAGHFDVGIEEYASEDIKGWSGNFRGFVQYRKMFANENII